VSGKTSLCEALEYALLGDVAEAGNKRIAARTYLANLHAGRFAPPVLKALDNRGRELDVASNPDTFRFCFVEKNRIDSFSRIAACPNAQRAELIATLFDMDQFSDFVNAPAPALTIFAPLSFDGYVIISHSSKIQSIRGSKSKGGGRPSLGSPWLSLGVSRATYFRKKNKLIEG